MPLNYLRSEGVVKQSDMEEFPPYGYHSATNHLEALHYVTPRTAGYTRYDVTMKAKVYLISM